MQSDLEKLSGLVLDLSEKLRGLSDEGPGTQIPTRTLGRVTLDIGGTTFVTTVATLKGFVSGRLPLTETESLQPMQIPSLPP
jgi:hypothetical protein